MLTVVIAPVKEHVKAVVKKNARAHVQVLAEAIALEPVKKNAQQGAIQLVRVDAVHHVRQHVQVVVLLTARGNVQKHAQIHVRPTHHNPAQIVQTIARLAAQHFALLLVPRTVKVVVMQLAMIHVIVAAEMGAVGYVKEGVWETVKEPVQTIVEALARDHARVFVEG